MPNNKKKGIKLLVLDVLKPHKPNIVEFGGELSKVDNVENIYVDVETVDEKTENVRVVFQGDDLDFEVIRKTIEDFGAVVHSVDKICIGTDMCLHNLVQMHWQFYPGKK
jgi:hypothetical protein